MFLEHYTLYIFTMCLNNYFLSLGVETCHLHCSCIDNEFEPVVSSTKVGISVHSWLCKKTNRLNSTLVLDHVLKMTYVKWKVCSRHVLSTNDSLRLQLYSCIYQFACMWHERYPIHLYMVLGLTIVHTSINANVSREG